jgi:hypothetical protein
MKTKIIQTKIYNTFLEDIKNGDTELADKLVTNLGYDMNEIHVLAHKISKQQSFLIKGWLQESKDADLLQRAGEKLQSALEKNMEKPVAYVRSLIEQNKIVVNYRNFKKLDIEEIKDIIKDQNLIELLEDLENETKS